MTERSKGMSNLRTSLRKKIQGLLPGFRKSSRPPHWPPIKGRSSEHERSTPTGIPPEHQAHVTEEQRDLERRVHEHEHPGHH
jgi:hypothetical protein